MKLLVFCYHNFTTFFYCFSNTLCYPNSMKHAKEIKALVAKAKQLNAKIAELKETYAELDQVTLQLEAMGFNQGHGAQLVDNFYCKNVSFKVVGINRYELKFKGAK